MAGRRVTRGKWEEGLSVGASGTGKGSETAKQHDAIFNELMQECKHSAPGARLSAKLRTALERLSPGERRAVCGRTRDGCAPLFVASRRGNAELVEYLVHVGAAELEQRGVYEVPDDGSVHRVTPLWVAAVCGRLAALRALADAGADVDAASDSGSTPVRSACFMTHVDVVRELVARGADIHAPNHNGGTCLINSVQSVGLCAFLLQHGARVDARDAQHKTVLHYAAQEHRAETARLLLAHGADPHAASRAGDDALRTAALRGAAPVVALLAARVRYAPARLADAYELLGATQLDEFDDAAAALAAWRRATALRAAAGPGADKRPARAPSPALGGAREWRGAAELARLAPDADALRTQALLVAARVLGPAHRDTVFRLMYRGAAYADAFQYQRCIDLWTWALEIRVEKDSLLSTDTCQTACALTRLMLDAHAGRLDRARGLPSHADVLRVFRLLGAHLPSAHAALRARPVCRAHADAHDRALRCATHLLPLLLDTARTDAQRADAERAVRALVAADVRAAHTGDTPLHLCASRLNVVRSTYFADEAEAPAPAAFPCVRSVRLLLACGAAVDVRNAARSTPLHVAAIPTNFSTELVEALLEGGAHLDQPNRFGDSPAELVALNRGSRVRVLRHVSLACLAARALLAAHRDVPALALPRTLCAFLDLHRP